MEMSHAHGEHTHMHVHNIYCSCFQGFCVGAVSKGPGVEIRNRWELEVLVDPRRGSPLLNRGQSHH